MPKLNLNELTNQLIRGFLPAAARQRNLLVNDTPYDLYIDLDHELAVSVINGLLSGIVGHIENGCIRISAKIIDNMILLSVADGNGYNDCGIIEDSLRSAAPVVNMVDIPEESPVITFNFPSAA